MKLLPRFISLVLAAGFGAILIGNHSVLAVPDSPGSIELFATDGGGTQRHLVGNADLTPRLVVNLNQAAPVTLQFPSNKIGMTIAVGSMDGGEVTSDQSTVPPSGQMLFAFRGSAPGLYRLVVQLPSEQYHLEIYVIDPNRPRARSRMSSSR